MEIPDVRREEESVLTVRRRQKEHDALFARSPKGQGQEPLARPTKQMGFPNGF
ncbi:hypothetical protein BDW_01835 [Bdellovibrio bacteriovorus W]|nr:hypothetical protein BDW_01835 [Bdellovibrio bacteriovorus W]